MARSPARGEAATPCIPANKDRIVSGQCARFLQRCQDGCSGSRDNMKRSIAKRSIGRITRILPSRHQSWGEAMQAELDYIDNDAEAVWFATGCMIALVKERVKAITGTESARLVFAALTIGLATFHLICAADGVRILDGGRDPFYVALSQSGPAFHTTAEQWRAMTPLMTLSLTVMGIANLLAAFFAARAQASPMLKAIGAATAAAFCMGISIFAMLGDNAGLRTFVLIMGAQVTLAILLSRFCMDGVAIRRV